MNFSPLEVSVSSSSYDTYQNSEQVQQLLRKAMIILNKGFVVRREALSILRLIRSPKIR